MPDAHYQIYKMTFKFYFKAQPDATQLRTYSQNKLNKSHIHNMKEPDWSTEPHIVFNISIQFKEMPAFREEIN